MSSQGQDRVGPGVKSRKSYQIVIEEAGEEEDVQGKPGNITSFLFVVETAIKQTK